jgi:hypothetical protein
VITYSLSLPDRLLEVPLQILDILDADADADQAVVDAAGLANFGGLFKA